MADGRSHHSVESFYMYMLGSCLNTKQQQCSMRLAKTKGFIHHKLSFACLSSEKKLFAITTSQLWARYLEGDKIPTKLGRDGSGDRDRDGLPDFLTIRDRARGGLPDPPRPYLLRVYKNKMRKLILSR